MKTIVILVIIIMAFIILNHFMDKIESFKEGATGSSNTPPSNEKEFKHLCIDNYKFFENKEDLIEITKKCNKLLVTRTQSPESCDMVDINWDDYFKEMDYDFDISGMKQLKKEAKGKDNISIINYLMNKIDNLKRENLELLTNYGDGENLYEKFPKLFINFDTLSKKIKSIRERKEVSKHIKSHYSVGRLGISDTPIQPPTINRETGELIDAEGVTCENNENDENNENKDSTEPASVTENGEVLDSNGDIISNQKPVASTSDGSVPFPFEAGCFNYNIFGNLNINPPNSYCNNFDNIFLELFKGIQKINAQSFMNGGRSDDETQFLNETVKPFFKDWSETSPEYINNFIKLLTNSFFLHFSKIYASKNHEEIKRI